MLAIEKLIKQKINKIAIEGFKVNPNIKAEPISNGRNRAKSGANRATQSRASKTEDKTSSSKKLLVEKEEENHLQVKNQEEIAIDLAQKEVNFTIT